MEIIRAPNKFVSNDDKDRFFIYLDGTLKPEFLDYLKKNININSIKYINKIVIFNSLYNLDNKSEEEKKDYFQWEDENIKRSDIYIILLDNSEQKSYYYNLGKYLTYFYEIYKNNISHHFILAYTKDFNNISYLKTKINLSVKDLLIPIEINDTKSYGDIILKKTEELYLLTSRDKIKHNVIHTEQEHYWSTNLGPKIKKVFCQAPWPESNFKIGIMGLFGIGKTSIYEYFHQGRCFKYYESYIGGNSALYEVEINNKKFIVDFEDTGSQERFKIYYNKRLNEKSCVIFVFDITNRESFDELKNNIFTLFKATSNNKFNVLVGSKLDLKYERTISYEEGDMLAEEKNMKYFEVSAKSGENMERLCNYIYNKFSKY